jgi:lipoprotein-anchoring transpeptidase ErfK/SrfK
MQPSNDNRRQSKKSGLFLLAFVVMLVASTAAQTAASSLPGRAKRHVVVSIPDRKLAVLENGSVIRIFPVAVGASVSPSPTGEFQIVNRVAHPTYYNTGVVIPQGPDNPIGTRWIGLDRKGYGIHGTNAPRSIGKAASHGCIRLRNRDIEQFFRMVSVGDTVEIRGERDAQMAELFGGSDETTGTTLARSETAVAGGQ